MKTIINYIKNNKHVWWALFLPVYFIAFAIVERVVPTTGYFVSQLPVDSRIPFVPQFVVFYCLWYVMAVGVGLILMIRDPKAFVRYMWFLCIGMGASLLICFLFPNGQDLRPETFADNGFFTRWVRLIYSVDTNTNVLPSMHVVGSIAVFFAVYDSDVFAKKGIRPAVLVTTVLINLSTVFIKQHSVLDIVAALVLCIPVYLIAYGAELKRHWEQMNVVIVKAITPVPQKKRTKKKQANKAKI